MTATDENEKLTELLKVYLGQNAGAQVASGGMARGDALRLTAAIMVADIRASTELIQSLPTDEYLDLLNSIFDIIAPLVAHHGGEVLQFTGDGVLAVYPESKEACEGGFICPIAVNAAFTSATECDRMLQSQVSSAKLGFGLSYGPIAYGNVGAADRLTFTVISAEVSKADRLQRLCPIDGLNIAMSGPFAGALPENNVRSCGLHSLKGFSEDAEVFVPC